MDRADRMRNVSAFLPSMVARLGVIVKNDSQLESDVAAVSGRTA